MLMISLDEQGLGIIKMVQHGFCVKTEARPSISLAKLSITALDCMTMCFVKIEIDHTIDTNIKGVAKKNLFAA